MRKEREAGWYCGITGAEADDLGSLSYLFSLLDLLLRGIVLQVKRD